MNEEAQKALATLVEVAQNQNADPDTRIRAAATILDWIHKTDALKRVAQ